MRFRFALNTHTHTRTHTHTHTHTHTQIYVMFCKFPLFQVKIMKCLCGKIKEVDGNGVTNGVSLSV